eukprot:TRINITY_DN3005_c0_g1_i5.p1 TRINITY_DN3005_c0_g1~~TRINITY_DN3005_c0_g1_i5.p1  ORF type:complete len:756 (+),score=335.62 TRINITY_DN3005_c0_g1_i5:41-2308(+)
MRTMHVPMDLETYNNLLALLVDSPDQDCAVRPFKLYEEMKDDCREGVLKPDLQTFSHLLQACERTGAFDKAFDLLSEMKLEFGLLPDTNMYNKLLGFCVLQRDEHRASSLFEEMKNGKVQPNVHTYNSLMNVFAENPAELLAQMFDDMIRQNIPPNRRTYNTLMRSCQRQGDYDKAFKLFEELKAEPLEPDVVTYNILIDMCKERIDFLQGNASSGAAANPNRRNEEQQESRIKGVCMLASSLFNEMDEKEIRPNTFTYNALMGVLARCADLRIFTVFHSMKEDAEEEEKDRHKLQVLLDNGDLMDSEGALMLAGLGDNTNGNGILMDDKSGAALRGHYQRLLIGDDYLARQSAFGVKPDITTYHTLLTAAERMGKAETAYELFDEMKEHGIQPDVVTYIKMMGVCCLNKETDRAYDLFQEASEKMVVPDIELYNAFVNVLAEAGDPEVFDSFQRFTTDRTNNLKPNHKTYNTMIKVCTKLRREGDPGPNDPLPTDEDGLRSREELIAIRNTERQQKGLAIYSEMCDNNCPVKPNADTYGALLDVCHLTKDIERARSVVDDMQARGLVPTITTYNKLMMVFVAANDPAIREIFDMLKQRNDPGPNLETYTILLAFYSARADPQCLHLFEDMKKTGIDPDCRVFNIMLQYCAKLRDDVVRAKKKSLKFFFELKLRELTPDIDTYNALMEVFAVTGDPLIFKVFEEMIENSIVPNKTTFSTLIKEKKGLDMLRKAGEKGLLDPHPDAIEEGGLIPPD